MLLLVQKDLKLALAEGKWCYAFPKVTSVGHCHGWQSLWNSSLLWGTQPWHQKLLWCSPAWPGVEEASCAQDVVCACNSWEKECFVFEYKEMQIYQIWCNIIQKTMAWFVFCHTLVWWVIISFLMAVEDNWWDGPKQHNLRCILMSVCPFSSLSL